MRLVARFFVQLLCFSVICVCLHGDTSGDEIAVPVINRPMPDLGDNELGRILSRYYERSLGGEERWRRLESLRIDGTLRLGEAAFILRAYQKKPNFLKMIVRAGSGDAVFGYDGEVAWRTDPTLGGKVVEMEPEEARRFIHNASFDTYLVYPQAPGKRVEFVDTVPAEGSLCHQLRVTLDTGYVVDYFIDIHQFRMIRSVSEDLRTGSVIENRYSDFTDILGFPMPTTVASYEDGEFLSELKVKRFTGNVGAMPFMFEKPDAIGAGEGLDQVEAGASAGAEQD